MSGIDLISDICGTSHECPCHRWGDPLTTHWRSGRPLMIFFPQHYRQQKESISNGSDIPYCIAIQSFLNINMNDWNNSITKRIDCTIWQIKSTSISSPQFLFSLDLLIIVNQVYFAYRDLSPHKALWRTDTNIEKTIDYVNERHSHTCELGRCAENQNGNF